MTPLSILVVDDDETSLAIIAALLESHGHNVTTQDTGFGTSRRILRDKPDVVVLDIEMPGLNGDDIIKLLRETATRRSVRNATMPSFVLYSGRDIDELQRLAKETGAIGAISKAIGHKTFLAEFNRVMRSHHANVTSAGRTSGAR